LVGGFPCQDYSVASLLKNSKGLLGKKGVLWWSIHKILVEKEKKPDYLILENVDRLLGSPAKQRGRDFAVMLACLSDLGYVIEWRVINAADYGFPQKRRRVFIVGYLQNSLLFEKLNKADRGLNVLNSFMSSAFPINNDSLENSKEDLILGTIDEISKEFNLKGKRSPFQNSGICINGVYQTINCTPAKIDKAVVFKDIYEETDIPSEFYVDPEVVFDKKKGWAYHKGPKKIQRIDKSTGHNYIWSEGKMSLTEDFNSPLRTIITSEGGNTPSRTKHLLEIVEEGEKKYRRLIPLELERANMFPDNHTEYYIDKITNKKVAVSANKRAFFMGNALVIGIIERIGITLTNLT